MMTISRGLRRLSSLQSISSKKLATTEWALTSLKRRWLNAQRLRSQTLHMSQQMKRRSKKCRNFLLNAKEIKSLSQKLRPLLSPCRSGMMSLNSSSSKSRGYVQTTLRRWKSGRNLPSWEWAQIVTFKLILSRDTTSDRSNMGSSPVQQTKKS